MLSLAQEVVYGSPYEKWLWQSGLGWWVTGFVWLVMLGSILLYGWMALETFLERRKRK